MIVLDGDSLEQKGYAQVQAEAAISELIQLNAQALRAVNRGYTPDDKVLTSLEAKYYEVLQNACEIIPTSEQDYVLNKNSKVMVRQVMSFINRLKNDGLYKVGKKKSCLMPVHNTRKNVSNLN